MNPDESFRWRLLLDALALLAAEAPAQQAWVHRHSVTTDELALDFDHAFRMAQEFVAEGLLDEEAAVTLGLIDAFFAEMSNSEDCCGRWSLEALAVDLGWDQARRIARDVLVRIHGEWRMPLPDITVIR